MKKLVIFDLDGTLLDTLGDLAASTNHALKHFGYKEHDYEAYRYFTGDGITKLIERALPPDARYEEKITQVRAEFISYYQAHKTELTHPYPGICDLLNTLHHEGIMLAVASNKFHEATRELIHFYFENGTFDVVLGQRQDRPTKPHPAIVNEILEITETEKDYALYVGDSEIDMQTAINSGIESVGVTWGFRPRSELETNGANHIVCHPTEILDLIKQC